MTNVPIKAQLIEKAEAFLERSGYSATRFGLEVAKDSKLLRRLKSGGDVNTATADKILRFIADHSPAP